MKIHLQNCVRMVLTRIHGASCSLASSTVEGQLNDLETYDPGQREWVPCRWSNRQVSVLSIPRPVLPGLDDNHMPVHCSTLFQIEKVYGLNQK